MHEFETGFFVGKPAWHGLGNVFTEENRPRTVEDGIIQSGLNWRAELRDLWFDTEQSVSIPENQTKRAETHRAVVRNTDDSLLGIVGNRFEPLQNIDAFKFFNPFLESGQFNFEAAGSLRRGKRIWILAKQTADSTFSIRGDDLVQRYLLLAHGHDGGLAINVGWTYVRVVCNNTLQGALNAGTSRLLRIIHTQKMHQALDVVQDLIKVGHDLFQATLDQYRILEECQCDPETLRKYVRICLNKEEETRTEKNILPMFKRYNFENKTVSQGETMWDAFNAMTEFVTHHQGRNAENRLNNSWFGQGGVLLKKSLDTALEMAA
jgi:phage/plasmid-like protein (TIGR03299 family)